MEEKRPNLRFETQEGPFEYVLDIFKGLPIIIQIIGKEIANVYTMSSQQKYSKEEKQKFKDEFANFSTILFRESLTSFKNLYETISEDSIYHTILVTIIKGRMKEMEKEIEELKKEKEAIEKLFYPIQ